jgi:hypothetical protein
MISQLYLILIDGNDDVGSQRDDDALLLPSKTIITATASPSSMITMNEDVPSLVSCSVIVNHTLNPYITRVCCTILNRLMMMMVAIFLCLTKKNSLKVKPSITAHIISEIDTMMMIE